MTNAKGEHDPKNREAIVPQVYYVSVPANRKMQEPMNLIIMPQFEMHKHEFFLVVVLVWREEVFSTRKRAGMENNSNLC